MKIRIQILYFILKIRFGICITAMQQIHNGFKHSAQLILTACPCLRALLLGTVQLPHFTARNYFPDTWNIVICRVEMKRGRKKCHYFRQNDGKTGEIASKQKQNERIFLEQDPLIGRRIQSWKKLLYFNHSVTFVHKTSLVIRVQNKIPIFSFVGPTLL